MSDTTTEDRIRAALREVIDPEVGMNIVDLGLIYEIQIEPPRALIRMTMTTPTCPVGPYLTERAQEVARRAAPELADVVVELVWEPPWSPEKMSEHAKKFFGWSGS